MKDALTQLIKTVKALRHPITGCPWDLKQTHETLRKHLIEEAYETIQAINNNDLPNLKEELGDVLLQVLLHSQIAEENRNFNIEEVISELNAKLIRRHPHVFENLTAKDADSALSIWEAQKQKEKEHKPKSDFAKNIPKDLPALMRAEKIGKESGKLNFDWNSPELAFVKVKEEFLELEESFRNNDQEKIEEELGDLLFSLSQFARKLNMSSELCTESANQKFIKRINSILSKFSVEKILEMDADQKLDIWKQVK